MVVEKFVEFKEPGRKKKNLTQSRLRPVSPFSYVGQGRKGAKVRT